VKIVKPEKTKGSRGFVSKSQLGLGIFGLHSPCRPSCVVCSNQSRGKEHKNCDQGKRRNGKERESFCWQARLEICGICFQDMHGSGQGLEILGRF